MMGIAELQERWAAHAATHPIKVETVFADGFLVLGAGTRLGKVGALDELRLASRLAAAHRRPVAALPLRHIKRAFDAMRVWDTALAYTHLALSGLNKLADPREDARWLFIIDALLTDGADPLTILKGLGTKPRDCGLSLEKYAPDQPRVPAGNPDGGQWTGANSENSLDPTRPDLKGVQVADVSTTRGQEIRSDVAPQTQSTANGTVTQLAQDTSRSCADYIAANCKASILREFPGQFLTQPLQDVINAAKAGDPAARKARKLLFDNRFAK
jgi:hypothetical protein